ncbi:MAG: hypothetical protein IKH30_16125 [Clostridia bacterium]|nr:hypothetical protein [Clostridia bacterium]
MKKLFSLILAALMLLIAVSCGYAELTGGWTPSESPEITEERQVLFSKAFAGLVGVSYVPVAYLGSQVVAGTNHCFLAQATVIYPDAQPSYVLIYLYENFRGEVEIMNIADLDVSAFCTYGAVDREFAAFKTAGFISYDLFVITRMNYGSDHKVTSVTGHYERIVISEEDDEPEIAPNSETTYQLAPDFTANMPDNLYIDYSMVPVSDLYEWYIDCYIGREDYDGHELVFTSDQTEEDTAQVDFWFVTTRIELNENNEIRYMEWYYVPWA